LGDKCGWKVAAGPSLFVWSLPWWFYLWNKFKFGRFFCKRTTIKSESEVDDTDILVLTCQNVYKWISFIPCSFSHLREKETLTNVEMQTRKSNFGGLDAIDGTADKDHTENPMRQ
jgi:hypothetical protein